MNLKLIFAASLASLTVRQRPGTVNGAMFTLSKQRSRNRKHQRPQAMMLRMAVYLQDEAWQRAEPAKPDAAQAPTATYFLGIRWRLSRGGVVKLSIQRRLSTGT